MPPIPAREEDKLLPSQGTYQMEGQEKNNESNYRSMPKEPSSQSSTSKTPEPSQEKKVEAPKSSTLQREETQKEQLGNALSINQIREEINNSNRIL